MSGSVPFLPNSRNHSSDQPKPGPIHIEPLSTRITKGIDHPFVCKQQVLITKSAASLTEKPLCEFLNGSEPLYSIVASCHRDLSENCIEMIMKIALGIDAFHKVYQAIGNVNDEIIVYDGITPKVGYNIKAKQKQLYCQSISLAQSPLNDVYAFGVLMLQLIHLTPLSSLDDVRIPPPQCANMTFIYSIAQGCLRDPDTRLMLPVVIHMLSRRENLQNIYETVETDLFVEKATKEELKILIHEQQEEIRRMRKLLDQRIDTERDMVQSFVDITKPSIPPNEASVMLTALFNAREMKPTLIDPRFGEADKLNEVKDMYTTVFPGLLKPTDPVEALVYFIPFGNDEANTQLNKILSRNFPSNFPECDHENMEFILREITHICTQHGMQPNDVKVSACRALKSGHSLATRELISKLTDNDGKFLGKILEIAIRLNDHPVIKELFTLGVSRQYATKGAKTLLHAAFLANNTDLAKMLISNGYSVTCSDNTYTMPLMQIYAQMPAFYIQQHNFSTEKYEMKLFLAAARNPDSDVLKYIISKINWNVSDLYYRDREGFTVLHHAILANNNDGVKVLIGRGFSFAKVPEFNFIDFAIKNNALRVCPTLIAQPNVNVTSPPDILLNLIKSGFDSTDITFSAKSAVDDSFFKLVKKVVSLHPVLDYIDGAGNTAMSLACHYRSAELVQILLQGGATGVRGENDTLYLAIHDLQTAQIIRLLSFDDLVTKSAYPGDINKTMLTDVLSDRKLDAKVIIPKLLEANVNPTIGPVLSMAISRQLFTIASLLMDYGATGEKDVYNGRPALLLAIEHRYTDLAIRMIEAGANNDYCYVNDMICAAVHNNLTNVVKCLIAHGTHVNIRNASCSSDCPYPDFPAVFHVNSVEMLEILIQNNASLDPINNVTPLTACCAHNGVRPDVISRFIELNVDIGMTCGFWQISALNWLVQFWNLEGVKILLKNNIPVNSEYGVPPLYSVFDHPKDDTKIQQAIDIVKLLLNHNADKVGNALFQISAKAIQYGSQPLIDLIENSGRV